jgi:cytochrome c oxidase subunit 2
MNGHHGVSIPRAASALVLLPALAGCEGIQSALDPAGPDAAASAWMTWLLMSVCTVVFVLVMAMLAWALGRGARKPAPAQAEAHPEPKREGRLEAVVGIAVAATIVILIGLTVASYAVNRNLFSSNGNGAVSIEITGHQWWWEVRYVDPEASRWFTTANEIHLPVGETVRIVLRSTDVIHSFWIPNLSGKKDLIPGQDNYLWLAADRPGLYRGQCAEFCGLQHAHMALFVVAEPREQFEGWAASQRQPAAEPTSDQQKRGRQVFLRGPCVMCHTVHGTQAQAITGPDLTHVASRHSIAAGRLPNTRGHRAGWIADPQTQKPGNQMPPIILPPQDFQALLSYLDILK